jgi:hypothetical protein
MNLKKREEKIKQKRMKTDFRDFIKEIGSWCPINLYKIDNNICRYPDTKRRPKNLCSVSKYYETIEDNIK